MIEAEGLVAARRTTGPLLSSKAVDREELFSDGG
jgi:hypothetical protein